jgi:hypothetical protein
MALNTNQTRSANNAITMTLNTPRRIRMPAVSPRHQLHQIDAQVARQHQAATMISTSTRIARTTAAACDAGHHRFVQRRPGRALQMVARSR